LQQALERASAAYNPTIKEIQSILQINLIRVTQLNYLFRKGENI